MRKFVGPVLCSMLVGASMLMMGCKASLTMGGDEPKPKPVEKPAEPEKPKPKPILTKKSKVALVGNKVKLPGPVVFNTASTTIDEALSKPTLDTVAQFMEENPDVTLLRVEGHTDSDGDDAANEKLSAGRAMAVAAYLTQKMNVKCNRLIPVGFGEKMPVAKNDTEEGKAQNRRTDFVVAARDGKAIDGKAIDGGGFIAGDPCKI
jgi:OmpA-OmpF porin, OOP family